MTKRSQCPNCHRPQAVCLCHAISTVTHRTPVHVMMHPSEQGNAKGTAQLLCQCLAQGSLWVGEQHQDFTELRATLEKGPKPIYLLYPDDNAMMVEQIAEDAGKKEGTATVGQLLVLDGTWRKTHKMLQLNPWLQQLPKLGFTNAPQGNYQIRKASRDDSLSTLEAVAYVLEQIEQCDSSPLQTAFTALKQSQLAFMPGHVRARYQ